MLVEVLFGKVNSVDRVIVFELALGSLVVLLLLLVSLLCVLGVPLELLLLLRQFI